MLNNFEDLFRFTITNHDTLYFFYRKNGKIYYDFTYLGNKSVGNLYSNTEEQLWNTLKFFTKIGPNPYYNTDDNSFLISKIHELEKRFLKRKGYKHAA